MADINALSQISERTRIHRKLEKSLASTADFLTFGKEVNDETKVSSKCIKGVAEYARKINRDLVKLKELIKDFEIQIGEKKKKLCESGFVVGLTYSTDTLYSRVPLQKENIDMQKLKNLAEFQKIADQQLELRKLLSETEGLILKVEEEGTVTLKEIDLVNIHVNKWIKNQQTEEERKERARKEEERKRMEEERKKKKEEEEAKRKAEEQKRKEEEEKRRKEEERRRIEEERKKEEEDRKRRNPDNWPIHIYDREKDNNAFHHGICCVVSAITGSQGLKKDDIECTCPNIHTSLDQYPQNKEEVLLSTLKIKSKTGKDISLELPMKVYIPRADADKKREVRVKVSINGGRWKCVEATDEKPKINITNVQFVMIHINNFQTLECVIVSCPKREHMIVKAGGGMFKPTEDKNVRIIVPPGCFNRETGVRFKVDKDLASRTKADKELNNIKIATSLHGIEFEDENLEKVDMEIYPDLHKIKKGSLHQKTLEKCKNKLVTDISVLSIATHLHKNGKITDEVLEEIKLQNSKGMKARRLLEEFKDCDMDQFNAMTDALEKENQGHLAQYLKKTMNDMKEEEANMGCDFIGEIDNLQLQVVSSCQNGDWKVMEKKALEDFPDGVVISLPAKGSTYDIMGLIVPKDMDNSTICRIADLLYRQSYYTNARLLVRQGDEDPAHGNVRCVESKKCQIASDEMKKQGFKKGPPDSPEFGICDGEEIIITMAGNLTLDSDNKTQRLKYYLNIDSARSTFKFAVYNKKAQSGDKAFSGELKYNVGVKEQSPPRSGTLVLYIPKDEEHHRYAPLTLDVPLKVSAKYLAWRISASEKLKIHDFLHSLAETNSEFRKLNQRAVKEAESGTAREMCEFFIMNWANQRPKSENKVHIISSRLRSVSDELAKEFDVFMKPFSQANGILSNNGIEELGKHIHTKWEILAQNLGINSTDIDAIKIDFHDDVRRAVRMLDQWRLSNSAIEKGTNVLTHLHKCVETSKCSQQVLKMIKAQQ